MRRRKRGLTFGIIVGRTVICLFTAIIMFVITILLACVLIAHGPSNSFRDMLVISAKQASATKWVPSLVMSKKTINEIMERSRQVNTDIVDADKYIKKTDSDEWEDSIDGMKLEFLTKPHFKAYVLLIKDPKRVKVGVSSDNFSSAVRGKRIFEIAEKYNAVAAINGGEFSDIGGRGSGDKPIGITYSFGKEVWSGAGDRTFIGFDKNDNLICKEGITKKEANDLGIRDAVCFQKGNTLIENEGGKIKLNYSDYNTGTSQRTAIGQRSDGVVIMLVTDGRSADSIGATKNEVIDIMSSYGAVKAAMLDGGSSAMLYYRNYFDVYKIDKGSLDEYQRKGLVNRYKAFIPPRTIPTFFIVTKDK